MTNRKHYGASGHSSLQIPRLPCGNVRLVPKRVVRLVALAAHKLRAREQKTRESAHTARDRADKLSATGGRAKRITTEPTTEFGLPRKRRLEGNGARQRF